MSAPISRRREEDWFAPRVFRAASRSLKRNATAPEPFFLFIDSFDPHEPWDPPRRHLVRHLSEREVGGPLPRYA
jgi:hypothetical protein